MIRQRGSERDLNLASLAATNSVRIAAVFEAARTILGFGSDAARNKTDFWGGGVSISELLANAPGGPYHRIAIVDVRLAANRIGERAKNGIDIVQAL
jgi:hypothetical protein